MSEGDALNLPSALSPRSSGRLVKTIVYKSFSKNHDRLNHKNPQNLCVGASFRPVDEFERNKSRAQPIRRGSALMLKVSTDAVPLCSVLLGYSFLSHTAL